MLPNFLDHPRRNTGSAHWPVWAQALGIAGLLLVAVSYLRWPLWPDHSLYLVMGRYWLGGLQPYRDVFDQNWPGTIWISQAILTLFGPTPQAVRLFDLLWQSAAGLVLYKVARKFLEPTWARGCLILYASLYLAATFGSTATRDTFAGLPLGLALLGLMGLRTGYAGLKGVGAGAMLALALFLKPTLSLVALFLSLGLLGLAFRRREPVFLKACLGLLAGLGGCLAVFFWYLLSSGLLPYFYDAAVIYAGSSYAQESLGWMLNRARVFFPLYPPGRLIILGVLAALLWWKVKPRAGWEEALVFLAALGALGSLLAQRKLSYVHAMPLCWVGSLALPLMVNRTKPGMARFWGSRRLFPPSDAALMALIWLLVLPVGADLPRSLASVLTGQSPEVYGDRARLNRGLPSWSLVQEAGELVQANSRPTDRLLCLTGPTSPDFYLAAQRPPAQRYVQPQHLGYDSRRTDEVVGFLSSNKSEVLIYSQDEANLPLIKAIKDILHRERWTKLFDGNIPSTQNTLKDGSKLFVYALLSPMGKISINNGESLDENK